MEKFRQTLEDCDLHDLGFVGDVFTWKNHHFSATSYIRERLDRAVANSAWRCLFPLVRVINGEPRHSDHRPIIVEVGDREDARKYKPMEIMHKFEARWLEEEECMSRAEEAWLSSLGDGEVNMMQLQKRVLGELWTWDREVLGELQKRINKARKDLERCRRSNITQEQVNREHVLRFKLERLQDQLHIYWKQRAHNTWLIKGDRNTKFFHAYASERRRVNFVKILKDDNGGTVEGSQLKCFIASQYQNLFLSHADGGDNVVNCIQDRVTREMNESLLAPFTGEEVWEALNGIGDLKAPGADGMPSIFYKKILVTCW